MTITPYQVGLVTGIAVTCLLILVGAIVLDVCARWYRARTDRRRYDVTAQAVIEAAETIARQAADR